MLSSRYSEDDLAKYIEEDKNPKRLLTCSAMGEDQIKKLLVPYSDVVDDIQYILLWKNPVTSSLLIVLVNFTAAISYFLNLAFINVFILVYVEVVFLLLFYNSDCKLRQKLLPKIRKDIELFSLDQVSYFISIVGSRIHFIFMEIVVRSIEQDFFGRISWICMLVCVFAIFKIVTTFVAVVFLLNSVLILPGALLNRTVYPSVKGTMSVLFSMMIIEQNYQTSHDF